MIVTLAYNNPAISFINCAYASSFVAVAATLCVGLDTGCWTLSKVSIPMAFFGLGFALGPSRFTLSAVGTSLVSSALVFRICGLALIVDVASLLMVAPVKKEVITSVRLLHRNRQNISAL